MPLGITELLYYMKKSMEIMLASLQWESCMIFSDDILVFGSSLEKR